MNIDSLVMRNIYSAVQPPPRGEDGHSTTFTVYADPALITAAQISLARSYPTAKAEAIIWLAALEDLPEFEVLDHPPSVVFGGVKSLTFSLDVRAWDVPVDVAASILIAQLRF